MSFLMRRNWYPPDFSQRISNARRKTGIKPADNPHRGFFAQKKETSKVFRGHNPRSMEASKNSISNEKPAVKGKNETKKKKSQDRSFRPHKNRPFARAV